MTVRLVVLDLFQGVTNIDTQASKICNILLYAVFMCEIYIARHLLGKKDGCISMNKLFAFNLKFVLLGKKNTSEMLHLCMLLHCRCCRSRHKLVMSNYFSTVELDLLI